MSRLWQPLNSLIYNSRGITRILIRESLDRTGPKTNVVELCSGKSTPCYAKMPRLLISSRMQLLLLRDNLVNKTLRLVIFSNCFLAVSGDSFCGRDNRRKSLLHIQTQFHSYSRGKLQSTTARAVESGWHSRHKSWIPATDLWWSLLRRILHIRQI